MRFDDAHRSCVLPGSTARRESWRGERMTFRLTLEAARGRSRRRRQLPAAASRRNGEERTPERDALEERAQHTVPGGKRKKEKKKNFDFDSRSATQRGGLDRVERRTGRDDERVCGRSGPPPSLLGPRTQGRIVLVARGGPRHRRSFSRLRLTCIPSTYSATKRYEISRRDNVLDFS